MHSIQKQIGKRIRLLILSGSSLLISSALWAQEATTETTKNASSTSVTGQLLQTTLSLLFLLILIIGVVWMLKRAGISGSQRRGGFYKVLATSALGPREKIVLIEVGNTWLVLGMTSHSINTLHSMPAGSMTLDEPHNPAASFAKMLERIKSKQTKS
jgi:flagellar protein FliO/FliZ